MTEMDSPLRNDRAVRAAAQLYESQGYEVRINARDEVPAELAPFANLAPALEEIVGLVDLVATRSGNTVLVEVRSTTQDAASKEQNLDALATFVDQLPRFRLDVVSIPSPRDWLPNKEGLLRVLGTATSLVHPYDNLPDGPEVQARHQAAIVMGVLALEGALEVIAARTAVATKRNQSIQSIAAALSAQGFLTPTDGDFIADIASNRNRIAHGVWTNRHLSRVRVQLSLNEVGRFVDYAFMEPGDLVASFVDHFAPAAEQDEPGTVMDTRTVVELRYASVPTSVREASIEALNDVSQYWNATPFDVM